MTTVQERELIYDRLFNRTSFPDVKGSMICPELATPVAMTGEGRGGE